MSGQVERILWGAAIPDICDAMDPLTFANTWPDWDPQFQPGADWCSGPESDHPQYWTSGPASGRGRIFVCGDCSSSFDMAENLNAMGLLENWDSVLAVSQQKGSGQMGRSWHSPAGNIHATLKAPALPKDSSAPISLLAGLALAKSLESHGFSVKLKWPNDLVVDKRKVGGILVRKRNGFALIGVGLNLEWKPSDEILRIDGAHAAGRLCDYGLDLGPFTLWGALTEAIRDMRIEGISADEIPMRIREIEQRLLWMNEKVLVRAVDWSNPGYEAIVLGLGDDGALKILREDKTELVYSASLLPPADK